MNYILECDSWPSYCLFEIEFHQVYIAQNEHLLLSIKDKYKIS